MVFTHKITKNNRYTRRKKITFTIIIFILQIQYIFIVKIKNYIYIYIYKNISVCEGYHQHNADERDTIMSSL